MERVRWRSAFLEGLAVLVGILLAFSADAAWDVRQEREEAREYLVAVRAELEANLEQITTDIEFIERVMDESVVFLQTVAGLGATPTYEETVRMVRRVSPRRPESLAQSALDDLVSSGGFGQIESGPLRRALSEYQRLLREDEIESNDIREHFQNHITPYHISEGSYTWDWEAGRGLAEVDPKFPLPTEPFAANRVYANILTVRTFSYGDLRNSRRVLAQQVREILALMDGAF